MNIATQYFITSLYHDKAYLLDLEYHTAKKHIIVATLFADNDFPVDSFSRAYDIYMKESYPRVEKTLITRQREANADVQPLLTKNQEIQQKIHTKTTIPSLRLTTNRVLAGPWTSVAN